MAQPGHLGQAFGFIGLDLVGMAQRQANVVETIDQAIFAESLHFERDLAAIGLDHHLARQINRELVAHKTEHLVKQAAHHVFGQHDGQELPFEVQAFRKYCLLNGFDDIGLTLRHADKIKAFEAERIAKMPWLAHKEL